MSEINSYKDRLEFYINSQINDVEKFISNNSFKIENKHTIIIKEKIFANNFVEEFTKSIKNNLLTKESTEIPNKEAELEKFIKDLKDKNGK